LPSGQSGQEAEFDTPENFPTAHASQMRFEVLFGLVRVLSASNVPGLHDCFVWQNGWPALSWNVPAEHGVQLAALAAPEKLPAGQSTHRSGVELVVVASYVPGLHGCFVSQYG